MRGRLNHLVISVVLTVLDAVVTLYYGTAAWAAWSGDILARGLLVLFVALAATSLANIWTGVGFRFRAGSDEPAPPWCLGPISTELRGRDDV